MIGQFFSFALIHVIVAVDNALLAGLILPATSKRYQNHIMIIVGIALAVTQVILAIGVGQLLDHAIFRIGAVAILIWMSIRTMSTVALPKRQIPGIGVICKVFFYTVMGNLDNMIWLGSELKGQYVSLTFFSIAMIPVFVIISVLLADQCERHQWLLLVGAGMMAWAAATLVLQTPSWQTNLVNMPSWAQKAAMGSLIVVAGFVVREFLARTKTRRV